MASRGVRNNNPGNIRKGAPWQGLASPADDGEFCCFSSPAYGIRAIARTLITYQDKRKAKDGSKIDTVQEIIERWAPESENNTKAYVAHAADALQVKRTDRVNVHDYAVMKALIKVIILHENGEQPYTDAQIDKGLVLAGIEPPTKSLSGSRTITGAQAATVGVAGTGLSDLANQIAPLVEYSEYIKYAFLALTLAGIGIAVYARWDDSRKGLR